MVGYRSLQWNAAEGPRLDHIWASSALSERISSTSCDKQVPAWPQPVRSRASQGSG
jgi:exonuclease III